jgi:hypothetical protein
MDVESYNGTLFQTQFRRYAFSCRVAAHGWFLPQACLKKKEEKERLAICSLSALPAEMNSMIHRRNLKTGTQTSNNFTYVDFG